MKYIKKYSMMLIIIFGFLLLFSNKCEVQAKTVSHLEEVNAKMLEENRASKFKVLATPQLKLKAEPTQQDMNRYYYNQLRNEISKNTYNTLTTELNNDIIVSLNNLEFDISETTEDAITECFNRNITPYIIDGYEAYIMDGAKNYWWTPDGIQMGYKNAVILDNKVVFQYAEITSPIQEWSNYESFNTKLKEVSDSLTGNSVYEIVRSINYYICSNVEYRTIDNTDIEQTAYGALMMNKAVCEGQAQLFSLLCREKGITGVNVYGYTSTGSVTTAHAWNYIYEPNSEKFYAVDVTWNNQLNDVLYFMVGSETEIDGVRFKKNHIPGFKQYVLQTFTPITPDLSMERYIEPITIDDNYMKNVQPNTTYEDFKKEFSKDISFSIKEGEKILTGKDIIKTGQIFDMGNTLTYTIVVTGDTNGDGQADIRDLLDVNKHRLNKNQLTGAYLKSADSDKNNMVDIKDILQINKYRLRKISEF